MKTAQERAKEFVDINFTLNKDVWENKIATLLLEHEIEVTNDAISRAGNYLRNAR